MTDTLKSPAAEAAGQEQPKGKTQKVLLTGAVTLSTPGASKGTLPVALDPASHEDAKDGKLAVEVTEAEADRFCRIGVAEKA